MRLVLLDESLETRVVGGREGGRGETVEGPTIRHTSSMHWPRPMPTVDPEMQEGGWLHALARCNAHPVPPRTVTGDEEQGRKSR